MEEARRHREEQEVKEYKSLVRAGSVECSAA